MIGTIMQKIVCTLCNTSWQLIFYAYIWNIGLHQAAGKKCTAREQTLVESSLTPLALLHIVHTRQWWWWCNLATPPDALAATSNTTTSLLHPSLSLERELPWERQGRPRTFLTTPKVPSKILPFCSLSGFLPERSGAIFVQVESAFWVDCSTSGPGRCRHPLHLNQVQVLFFRFLEIFLPGSSFIFRIFGNFQPHPIFILWKFGSFSTRFVGFR